MGDQAVSESTDIDELQRQWRTSVSELQDIDGTIQELRDELQQFEARREIIARREASLRKQELTGRMIAAKAGKGPLIFELAEDADATPTQASANGRPAESVSTPRRVEDWEVGLDSFGVAKCGVCGMKLPLDAEEIEKHSLECEAAQRSGNCEEFARTRSEPGNPRVADLMPGAGNRAPRDRAASLREKLAASSRSSNG
mmetsp:Transcript_36965/g.69106  ORF Transcript_36965/g.69106 Transcript_36965/m.69106 type:complete len:200 (-) Transcript_36965:91-690(-)